MYNKELRLSTTNKMYAGVCGGLAEHLNIDVVLVRVLMVVAAFCGSVGFWVYFILWFVLANKK